VNDHRHAAIILHEGTITLHPLGWPRNSNGKHTEYVPNFGAETSLKQVFGGRGKYS